MGGVGSAFINILPNFGKFGSHMTKGFNGPVTESSGAVEGLVKNIEGIPESFGIAGKAADAFTHGALKNFASLGHTMTTKLALGAETAFAGFGVKQAANVERGLREVNSLFGKTGDAAEAGFGRVQSTVKDLSKDLGVAQDTLTGGLYQAISAGVPKENVATFLTVATKAAIGGVSDTETAVDGLSSTLNAFGMDTADVQKVADSFFVTVAGGKTNFAQLAQNISNVAPVAAAVGVSLQELNAAIATLTASGIQTGEATTNIRAAIVGLTRPSEELNAIFTGLGFESAEAAIHAKGLGFALDAVFKATGGSQGKLQGLLGSVEAVNAALILSGTKKDFFAQQVDAQQNAVGASQKAFDELEKSQARSFEKFRTSYQNFAIAMGEALGPAIRLLTGALDKLVGAFEAMPEPMQQVLGTLAFLVTALGPPIYMFYRLYAAMKLAKAISASLKLGAVAAEALKLGQAAAGVTKSTLALSSGLNTLVKGTMSYRAAMLATKAAQFGSFIAANALPIAAVSAALVIGTSIFMHYRKEQQEATARVKEFKDALDEETGALTDQNTALIAKQITDQGLDKAAGIIGVSVQTVTRAMLGQKDAIDDVNNAVDAYNDKVRGTSVKTAGMSHEQAARAAKDASDQFYAANKLKGAVADQGNTVKKALSGWERDASVKKEVAKVTGTVADATKDLSASQVFAAETSKKAQSAFEALFGTVNIYKETLDSINEKAEASGTGQADKIKSAAKATVEAVKTRIAAEKTALEATHKAELDRLIGSAAAQEAVRTRQQAETAALDARGDAEIKGAETTEEAEGRRADAVDKSTKRTVLSAAELKAAVVKKVADTKAYFANLAVIAARGGSSIIGTLLDLGPAAADLVKEVAGEAEPEFIDFVKVVESGSVDALTAMRTAWEGAPAALKLIGEQSGEAFANGLLERLKSGKIDLATILDIASGLEGPAPGIPSGLAGYPVEPHAHEHGFNLRGYATGGRFSAGQMIRVGERGEELVRFGSSGEVIPNGQLSGGGGITVHTEVHARTGASAHEIAAETASINAWRLRPMARL